MAAYEPAAVAERRRTRQRPRVPESVARQLLAPVRATAQQHLPLLRPGAGSLSRPGGRRTRRAGRPQKESLDARAGGAAEERARREDARVVAHQHVALAQEAGQVAEDAVLDLPVCAPVHEQSRRVPGIDRALSDQDLWELVLEVLERKDEGPGVHDSSARGSHVRAGIWRALRARHPDFLRATHSCHASHLLAAQPQYGCRYRPRRRLSP